MAKLLELTLPVAGLDPEHEAVSAAVDVFAEHVHGGAVVELSGFGPYGEIDPAQVLVRGYVSLESAPTVALDVLRRQLLDLPFSDMYGELQTRWWEADEWADAWKQHYRPIRIGTHLIISPTWESPETMAGDHIIWLDPGMAFGTGTHPSTQLILRLLERYLAQGDRMLDVGTGSGILAIAAIHLGASYVQCTDIDPVAIATANENVRLNGVGDSIDLVVGSVPTTGHYHVVCANIFAETIADLLIGHDLATRLQADGILLLSGIIQARRHVVDLALASQHLFCFDSIQDGDWIALAVRQTSAI